MNRSAEVVVIGAGPGGYVAAIRLAQLGRKPILIDRDRLGGECLNYGCIPSKALIHAANLYEKIRKSADIGISTADPKIDVEKLQSWKQTVVDKLVGGVATLCKGHGIEVITGEASFESSNTIKATTPNGEEIIKADSFIIATGSKPIELPGFELGSKKVISSKEALQLQRLPRHLLVVGGGAIGLEIGILYAKFGSKLTIVELTEQLLPGTDADLVNIVSRTLKRLGATIFLQSKVVSHENGGELERVVIDTPSGRMTLEVDVILESIGRKPRTEGLGLEKAGVELSEKGFIKVDRQLRTSVPSIFAIGDVVGPPFLAHKASKEGIVAAEVIAGQSTELDYRALPATVFSSPEVATVGMNESQLQKSGRGYNVGRFPFVALGRALTNEEPEGFVKVLADKETDEVLGVEIVGAGASDLISEAALAIEMGATSEDLALTIHPHPTLPESIMEAAEAVKGKAINILRR